MWPRRPTTMVRRARQWYAAPYATREFLPRGIPRGYVPAGFVPSVDYGPPPGAQYQHIDFGPTTTPIINHAPGQPP